MAEGKNEDKDAHPAGPAEKEILIFQNEMNLLTITDKPNFYNTLQDFLSKNQYEVFFCRKQEDIGAHIRDKDIKIVIMDLTQKEIRDHKLLKLIKNSDPLVEVVIIGDPIDSEKIIESIRLGASEYIEKPLKFNNIKSALKRINEKRALRQETLLLEKELNAKYFFHGMVAKNLYMLEIFSIIERIAKYFTSILITGETGTGKEMVARAVHYLSPHSEKKLVICHCSTIPETLFESELFGYVRGAFTGAEKTKKGLFEEAHEGTVFLDEMGDVPLPMQSKLLRVLEDHQFRRLGSNENISVDVRIIAATNQDLRKNIKNRTFREDLFHRLNTVEINLPSLRERTEDISLLSRYFLNSFNNKFNKEIQGISQRVQKIFLNYKWSGNVRELENVLEHSVMLCPKKFIDINDLPKNLQEYAPLKKKSDSIEIEDLSRLDQMEKQHIIKVLERTNKNIKQAAQILGISRYTLYRKLKNYSIT